MVAKIEWHVGELLPRIGFIVTNSRLTAGKAVKVYNGRGDVESRREIQRTIGSRSKGTDMREIVELNPPFMLFNSPGVDPY